jgi:hypothetical protein
MIKALCVDDTKRPDEIPIDKWVVADTLYTITHVYKMIRQGGILGFALREINLERILNGKYTCFRSDRFGIAEKDIPALLELAKNCADLDDFDVLEAINKELELYPVEIEQ